MKRVLMVIGLPVLLGLVWWSGENRSPDATAEVAIDVPDVGDARELVMSRLATVEAVKTVEDTTYTDGGESELTFRVPAGRLEEAIRELKTFGAKITRQRVELDELTADADELESRLDEVSGCLTSLSDQLGSGGSSGDTVAECRQRLDDAGQQLRATPEASQDAVLNVLIRKKSTTNPALVAAVVLLALALATMAYLTIRSTRADRIYDITESRPTRAHEDLYHRRN